MRYFILGKQQNNKKGTLLLKLPLVTKMGLCRKLANTAQGLKRGICILSIQSVTLAAHIAVLCKASLPVGRPCVPGGHDRPKTFQRKMLSIIACFLHVCALDDTRVRLWN